MEDMYANGPTEANLTRARWAVAALETFGKLTGQNYLDGSLKVEDDILLEIGGDLVANLFHLARLNGCTPDLLTDAGLRLFEEEVWEEEEEKRQTQE